MARTQSAANCQLLRWVRDKARVNEVAKDLGGAEVKVAKPEKKFKYLATKSRVR